MNRDRVAALGVLTNYRAAQAAQADEPDDAMCDAMARVPEQARIVSAEVRSLAAERRQRQLMAEGRH